MARPAEAAVLVLGCLVRPVADDAVLAEGSRMRPVEDAVRVDGSRMPDGGSIREGGLTGRRLGEAVRGAGSESESGVRVEGLRRDLERCIVTERSTEGGKYGGEESEVSSRGSGEVEGKRLLELRAWRNRIDVVRGMRNDRTLSSGRENRVVRWTR